ncbi:MAG: PKD domain-containing protein, partial [Gemmatimonadetes bacterium]|nr:PKD domain-containing protein [Gemmatimonadota bacterium]
SPVHTYASAGSYTVTLTVTDDRGASASATQTVAPAPNQVPTAKFQTQCSGTTCTFLDKSTDSDGTLVSWTWDFGNGGSSNTQNPTTTYPGSGRFRVWLTVTDNAGATSQATDLLVCKVRGGSLECR